MSRASGGVFTADVIQHQSGSDPFPRKMLGKPRYEDIEVEVGAAMPAPLFDWIAASWGASPPSMDGAVLGFDSTFTLRREQGFTDALIAETAFPALDATSKQIGRIGVRITPRELLPPSTPSPGTKLNLPLGKSPHKAWQVAAFKLELRRAPHLPRRADRRLRRPPHHRDLAGPGLDDQARPDRLPQPARLARRIGRR